MRGFPTEERGASKLLLHICCAPDATVPTEDLRAEGWDVTGFFYGGNIHPREEYDRRLEALHLLREHAGFPSCEPDYDAEPWFAHMKERGLMNEPEGGRRCAECFRLQLTASAEAAVKLGCSHLCTTLTISPHKDAALINVLGREISGEFGLIWEERVWRKKNGFLRSINISKELGLYRQNYCGCAPSMRTKI